MRFKKLTMPQAYRLIGAAFARDPVRVRKALAELMYHLRRNFVAYQSHRKKNLLLLESGKLSRFKDEFTL